MVDRARQIEEELKNLPIEKDQYNLWLQNDVTRYFRLKIEEQYLEVTQRQMIGSTIEQIAMNEIVRSTEADVIKDLLEWNPFPNEE